MKTNLTFLYSLLPVLKVAQAFIQQKSLAGQQLVASGINYLLNINFSWVKLGNYVFSALRQAFRDNILSEIEMEFLLLAVTGIAVSLKNTVEHYISDHFKYLKTQHSGY